MGNPTCILLILTAAVLTYGVQAQAPTPCGGLATGQSSIGTELYQPIKVPNAPACQQVCTIIPECTNFSWYSVSKNCYMMSDSLYSENATEAISGPTCDYNMTNSPCCQSSIDEGVNYVGGDIGSFIVVDSAETCQLLCGLGTQCRYFSFDDSTSRCFLKSVGFTVQVEAPVISGKGCYQV
eukprot:TRINITY_DN57556_c0_g1_i3.p1 TRINITY_DN57556_c0_g1~~TRINITY_DN57556_c0_g1_i3.p1  ORF type:complete len:181 (-),score=5.49 TRINITY_DN57556_c0_g1_i3:280-822(-)